MSTPGPGGSSRRRRIAGERRPTRPAEPAVEPADAPTQAASAREAAQPPPPTGPPVSRRPPAPPAPPTAAGASARRGWWGSSASVLVLAGILTVVVVLTGLTALGVFGPSVGDVRSAEAAEAARTPAVESAERAAAVVLGYDHRTLDADADQARRFMTEEFAEEYTETFDKVVRPTAEQTRAVVTADVKGAAVLRASESRVRVLLFVDQVSVSRSNDAPQVALNRVEMIMVERDGEWLVEDLSSY